MNNSNKYKSEKLGMPMGTAWNRLRKMILFKLVKNLKFDYCFQCGAKIESVKELSIEHKIPWQNASIDLFWDTDNIAFSHLSCNSGAAKSHNKGQRKHPSVQSYKNGCRCDECKEIQKLRMRKYRKNKG